MLQALKQAGIGSEVYYPVAMHKQECFLGKCRVTGSLHESEDASNSVLAVPIYPELSEEMIEYVAGVVIEKSVQVLQN
jgi:dTDP-4-amino-4,6-dideoxygalactose transaminase